MSKIRSKDTSPERVVRSILHKKGYRFRLHRNDLPGKPDIVLPKHKKAIFVHGCFWHQHKCKNAHLPKSNTQYWKPKFDKNRIRDKEHIKALRKSGWKVLVIWECWLKDLDKVEEKIINFMNK